jgi:predicted heme/steroid binding protein
LDRVMNTTYLLVNNINGNLIKRGVEMAKNITLEELGKFNGTNGLPAYVAYQDKVYDVSNVFANGEHKGCLAGVDLSATLANSPHQEDIFNNFSVVGNLVHDTGLVSKIMNFFK